MMLFFKFLYSWFITVDVLGVFYMLVNKRIAYMLTYPVNSY